MPRREMECLEREGLPGGWSIRHAPPADLNAGWFELRRPPTLEKLYGELGCSMGVYSNGGLGCEHEFVEQPYCCNDGVDSMEFVSRDQFRARMAFFELVLEMYPDA